MDNRIQTHNKVSLIWSTSKNSLGVQKSRKMCGTSRRKISQKKNNNKPDLEITEMELQGKVCRKEMEFKPRE